MTRLLLWRHGQTTWNADGRIQGQQDVELSDLGREQAATAAQRLAAMGPTRIVSSDLRRAGETAGALAAVTGLPVQYDSRLRERDFGPWQGKTMAEIAERWPEEYERFRVGESYVGAGVETVADLGKRAVAAFEQAATEGGVVVVATHGGLARVGAAHLLGWPEKAARTLRVLRNCCWTEVCFEPRRGWQLMSHNCG